MTDLNYIDRTIEIKIAGQDSSGNGVNYVSADANGNMLVKDYSAGPVTPGSVASVSNLIGGQYNTALPTFTNGQQGAIQVDSSGRLYVNLATSIPSGANTIGAVTQASGPWTMNLTQVGGSSVILGQTIMSTSIPVTIASNQTALPVSQSGTWTTGRTWALTSGADSISVIQSTSPWITKDQSDGPVTPGSVASFSQLMGGQFNTVLPVLTNTQQTAIQLDSSGRLIVSPSTSSSIVTVSNLPTTVDTNYGTVGANTIRTASEIGNATGAALFGAGTTTAQVLRVVLPTDQTAIPVTQSGAWAVTANAGTNLNTSALALDTSVNGILVTQGSTTSGEKGPIVQAAVTTATPTYTTGQTNPLSLNVSGGLRVDGSGVTQPISGTVTATQASGANLHVNVDNFPAIQTVVGNLTNNNAAPVATNIGVLPALAEATLSASRYTTGDQVLLVTDLAGNTNVDLQYYLGTAVSKTNPIATTISDGTNVITAAISAYGTAPTGTEVMGVNSFITNAPNITNITGTISLPTGASTSALQSTGNTSLATIATNTNSLILAQGSSTSGQAGALTLAAVTTSAPTYVNGQTDPISLNTTGDLRVIGKITDGTNGPVAVKPASTAATAADPALVVTISPNSPSQSYSTGSGTISALNGNVAGNGGSAVSINITGTWVGTLTTQATNGDGTWINVGSLSNQTGLITSGTSINGTLEMNGAGWVQIRLVATTWTSGTANVTWSSTPGSHVIIAYSVNGANFNTYTTLTDSLQNPLGTTAASTAATAAQEALVVAISPNSSPPTFSDKTSTGTIVALNGTVVATTGGCSSVTFDITGTWVATIIIEGTTGDGNWFAINGDVDITDSISGSFTANTFVTIPCGSFSQVRLRASLYTSGTANISWNASAGINTIEVFNTNPASFLTTSRTQDGSGNNINSINNQLQVRDVLNTTSQYRAQSVTTSAAEALGAATILINRKLISITPTNGTIYWGFSSGVTTATGTPLFPNNTLFLSVTDNVHVYLISATTTDVRIAEVS